MNPKKQALVIFVSVGVIAIGWTIVRHVQAAPTEPVPQEIPASAAPSSSASTAPQVIEIVTNTQATIDDVRIAAYNFRDENGPSCALQVFVRDDESKNQKLRVHKGQTFTASGKSFEVLDVGTSSVKLSVK